MDFTLRYIVALGILLVFQILFGGTVVFLVRRWKQMDPPMPWLKVVGLFFLLGLLVTVIGLVPVVGRFAALIVSLIGLKRISGFDLLSTFILSFCMGILVFVIAGVISSLFQVDLLG